MHFEKSKQEICFFPDADDGTHQRYTWVSTTFPEWTGRAAQEGDQIFMQGDFPFDLFNGHDAMMWEIVTTVPKTEGSGHWTEWLHGGGFSIPFFDNVRFTRLGECQFASAAEAIQAGKNVRSPVSRSGRRLSPSGSELPSR